MKDVEINERIRDASVRLIDENGEQLGIVSSTEAKRIASSKNLDLVKISPMANPPVCKIMDYGKFKFEAQKREKEARKKQKVADLKEIRLSMTIDIGDVKTKAKHALKFLKDGDRVKVSIRMRGRQQAHADIGLKTMQNFYEILADHCTLEKKPTRESNFITMFLAPLKKG